MRFHQSWWRHDVLGVAAGCGPTRSSAMPYGNMLEVEDGAAGRNSLTPGIAAVAEARMGAGGGVEPFRCRRNLLSSQPMAFNLFGPMVADAVLAGRLASALWPDGAATVDEVRIEWAPSPKDRHLGDRTAFDVFVAARAPDGARVAIGVECKLTEPFSTTVQDPTRYRARSAAEPQVWRAEALDQLADRRWMQLWRNHLLARSVAAQPDRRFDRSLSVVVGHPQDPSLVAVVEGYRSLLTDEGRVEVQLVLFDQVVSTWRAALTGADDDVRGWLDAFDRRYLRREESEALWTQRGARGR